MASKRKTVGWLIACLAAALIVVGVVSGWLYYEREYGADWAPARIRQSIDDGDRIVAMTLRFKREHGRYPTTLGELVPKYLPEIRPPSAGTREWHYEVVGNEYVLWFAATDGKPAYIYRSDGRGWEEER